MVHDPFVSRKGSPKRIEIISAANHFRRWPITCVQMSAPVTSRVFSCISRQQILLCCGIFVPVTRFLYVITRRNTTSRWVLFGNKKGAGKRAVTYKPFTFTKFACSINKGKFCESERSVVTDRCVSALCTCTLLFPRKHWVWCCVSSSCAYKKRINGAKWHYNICRQNFQLDTCEVAGAVISTHGIGPWRNWLVELITLIIDWRAPSKTLITLTATVCRPTWWWGGSGTVLFIGVVSAVVVSITQEPAWDTSSTRTLELIHTTSCIVHKTPVTMPVLQIRTKTNVMTSSISTNTFVQQS